MKSPDLSTLVTKFFLTHLAAERNVTPNTVIAYRDALKLFLQFAAKMRKRKVDALVFDDLTPNVVLAFLDSLESVRRNCVRTRNARLAAIHSFFRYVMESEPSLAVSCQRVLTIRVKKAVRPMLGYLNADELDNLLRQVDRTTLQGPRDYLLLTLLYDTGARIQELLDMKPADFYLKVPSFVRVLGKGRKERMCPLLKQTARLVSAFFKTQGYTSDDDQPVFQNRRGQKLTRQGTRYLLKKYLRPAAKTMPSLNRRRISLHTLRHTKAMHLLQSGVPIMTIKDVLGHATIKSTEIYAQTDPESKRKALEQAGTPARRTRRSQEMTPALLKWLESL